MKRNQTYLAFSMIIILLVLSCDQKRTETETLATEEKKDSASFLIAYNVLMDDTSSNYDILLTDAKGSYTKNLTNTPDLEWSYLSRNDVIYFVSDRDTCDRCYFLYSMDYNEGEPKRVYDNRLADSWMSLGPNGKTIIVTPHETVDSAFHIIDLRSGFMIERIPISLPSFGDPLFINNGKNVVFRGGETKSRQVEGYNEDLYITDLGGNVERLTYYPVEDTSSTQYYYRAGAPRQHPKEKFISFQSKQNGQYSLYAVEPDGSAYRKLTNLPFNTGWHSWSKDGKWLAVEIFDNDQSQFHILVMNWDTKEYNMISSSEHRFQHAPVFIDP